MSMASSTANWHWKNKNVTRWGKEWFERELVTVSVDGDSSGESVKVTKVTEVDGDVELGQRKSKLITIYDCQIKLDWEGTTSDGTNVTGSLSIPEVSHEITVDKTGSYVYDWSVSGGNSAAEQALLTLAKTRLVPLLEETFARFPAALVDTHGKDLTVSAEPSRAGTPNQAASAPKVAAASSSSAPAQPKVEEKKGINTTTVQTSADFMAPADDLFSLLTDEKRIPSWTRAPAQSKAQPDTEYSLFAGGVKGKYVSLDAPKEIVQTWALQSPTWPAGHTATLKTTLNQSSDSTKLTLSLSGVPTGMEEDVKRNIEGYYIMGLKSIGYVPVSYSSKIISSPSRHSRTGDTKRTSTDLDEDDVIPAQGSSSIWSYIPVFVVSVLVLGVSFAIPLLSLKPPSRA